MAVYDTGENKISQFIFIKNANNFNLSQNKIKKKKLATTAETAMLTVTSAQMTPQNALSATEGSTSSTAFPTALATRVATTVTPSFWQSRVLPTDPTLACYATALSPIATDAQTTATFVSNARTPTSCSPVLGISLTSACSALIVTNT